MPSDPVLPQNPTSKRPGREPGRPTLPSDLDPYVPVRLQRAVYLDLKREAKRLSKKLKTRVTMSGAVAFGLAALSREEERS